MTDDSTGSRNLIQEKKNNQEKKQSKFAKFFGIKQREVTEDEILELVDDARETGSIDDNTGDLIENVLDFADKTAGDIMTHRTEMTVIEDNKSLNDLVNLAIESGRSRIPVYHEDTDNITGAIHVKDLLKYVCSDAPDDIKISDIARPVLYIPSSKICSQLFSEMTATKTQLAIVIDEYGGTAGLITMEDLLESIVGNIQDEYDDEEESVVQLSENVFSIDGATTLSELMELTGEEVTSEDCETVAGLILEVLSGIPEENERPTVHIGKLKLTADEIEDRRITKVLVEIECQ